MSVIAIFPQLTGRLTAFELPIANPDDRSEASAGA